MYSSQKCLRVDNNYKTNNFLYMVLLINTNYPVSMNIFLGFSLIKNKQLSKIFLIISNSSDTVIRDALVAEPRINCFEPKFFIKSFV